MKKKRRFKRIKKEIRIQPKRWGFRSKVWLQERRLRRRSAGDLTFAVLSRLSIVELPYIRAFLDYYRSLGVARVHLQVSHPRDRGEIEAFLTDYIDCGYLRLYDIVDMSIPLDEVYNEIVPHIEEDLILNVDVDEFLSVAPARNLHEFLEQHPLAYIYFHWEIIPNDGLFTQPLWQYSVGGTHGKYMIMRGTTSTLSHHTFFGLKEPRRGKLIHFWGRSFPDVLLKALYQRFDDAKTSSKQDVLARLGSGDIPVRLKVLAWLCLNPSYPLPDVEPIELRTDTELEKELLSRFLSDQQVKDIYSLYVEFKEGLREKCPKVKYPGVKILKAAKILDRPRRSSNSAR